ncbi:ABC transporter permease [Larkinella sp. VNQ87]|uniref:ABC transporter permease n=1 Tax=Larkinella sp. VNQ87 TaxID=3400921 RepID=UPI003C0BFB25
MQTNPKPNRRTAPRWAHWLLTRLHPSETLEEVEGDLEELYGYWYRRSGKTQATLRYGLSVLSVLPPWVRRRNYSNENRTPFFLHPTMLKNYLKIAFRTIGKHKVPAFINVLGLTLGLTSCLLIAAYVVNEFTYDRFHQQADRIVLFQQFENTAGSGGKFATDLKKRFSTVADAVRLTRLRPLISRPETAFYEPNFWFADSSVFSVFTLPLVQGNPKTALSEQYGVVLSETMARKYFGSANPMGKPLRINNKATLHVTGVLKDLPTNSHQPIDFLATYLNANELVGYDVTTNYWGGSDTWTYLLLTPGTDKTALQAQLLAYIAQLGDPNSGIWKPNLVPLTDIYLRTNLVASNRLMYAYVFTVVALLILGLACFNYVNLTTAQATQRAKEVGVRKVMGSSFGQLCGQFLSETAVFMAVAVLLSGALLPAVLPAFSQLTDKPLALTSVWAGARIGWLVLGLLAVVIGAGSYPAFVLSSFQPITVLKGGRLLSGRTWLRKILIVGQFAVSIGMMVATVVVYEQLTFVRNHNVGYQRDQVLTLDLQDASAAVKDRIKQQITSLPGVEAATRAFSLPGSGSLRGQKLVSEFVPKGAKDASIGHLNLDGDFLRTFGIKLVAGRNLDPNRPADQQAFLVNRAAMQYFGWKTITGKTTGFYTYTYDTGASGGYREVPRRGEVVGVIDDYNHADLKQTVAPMIFSLNEGFESQLAVRIRAGAIPETVRQLGQLWRQQFPEKPFTYDFLDDTFNRTYQVETRTGQVFAWFAGLAILISCLGLYGLAMFTAEQRTKEIGIRKVLGASLFSITRLVSADFVKLVIIALFVATPLAWYAMRRWLEDFAYRISVEWWVFALSGLLAVGIALITVSFQSVKAALMNPVKTLRSE